jgi:NitT/TauT family transport system substrate-binding protein
MVTNFAWRLAQTIMRLIVLTCCVLPLLERNAVAETVKIGLLKAIGGGPIFLAQDDGYFASQGLSADLVYFDSAQPIAVAVASGAVDFGLTGFTAGFFTLADQGALRLIAGFVHEVPGFPNGGYVVSQRAFDAGLRSLKELGGHSVAVTQVGSGFHLEVGLVAEKYGVDLKSVHLLPLQSTANIVSALTGGQADAAVLLSAQVLPLLARGDAKLLGWVGDETPLQSAGVFTAKKTADARRDVVERFLRAYREGSHAYHDAFIDQADQRRDSVSAPQAAAVIAKYIGLTPTYVASGISYIDADGRLDVKSVLDQIAWFKSQGLLKSNLDGQALIDRRYVQALPGF